MAFLSQASRLGSLLLPHDAFQEHATHPAEWSAKLSSKGSERTCIRLGLTTFLYCTFTAHPNYVVERVTAHRKPPDMSIWRLSVCFRSGRNEMDPPLCGSTAMSHNEFKSSEPIEP